MLERHAGASETRPRNRFESWGIAVAGLAITALFSWNVFRLWFIGDDAFITFRYAKHLAAGQEWTVVYESLELNTVDSSVFALPEEVKAKLE